MPFDIAIVGAGISGLAAAIALSRDGHKVRVYERRSNTQQGSGSGLQIQPSAIKILRKLGLLDGFAKVAHESGSLKMVRFADGSLIAEQQRKGARGQWYCLRNALRKYLYDAAIASGAAVQFDARVRSVAFEAPSLMLENGSTVAADIVIAADGTNSGIRQIMFPGAERKLTDQYVFQANIPREAMYEEEFTKPFYEDPATRVYLGPNSWSFASVAAHQSIYDMQLVLRDFALSRRDPHPERLLEPLENLDMIGDSIDAWDPQYKSILAKATTFFKWRVAEAPHLPTALAKGGKVVLIGDAYHGIDPSAGFGTALSLEDGFTLALLLSKAPSLAEVPTYLSIYDKIQRERSGAVGKYSTFMGMFLGLPDGQVQTMRDKAMRKFDPNSTLDAKASIRAKYGTPEWQAYMDDYEPEKAVEDALREHAKETALEPGSVTSRM